MHNPIFTFFDGTRIDLSAVLDVSRENSADPHSQNGHLSVEFAITYRGLERPRRFQYVVKNLVDDGALGHSLWEAYWNGRDDLAQIAVDALDCKVAELVHEWAEFRLEQLAVQNA